MRRGCRLIVLFLGVFILCSSMALGAGKSQTRSQRGTPASGKQEAGEDKRRAGAPRFFHVKAGEAATIQSQIDLAQDGDSVVVGDGTYSGPGNVGLDFKGKAVTVKSANGPENCILDVQGNVTSPMSSGAMPGISLEDGAGDFMMKNLPGDLRGVVFQRGETIASVLDGFTIKNGAAQYGAAILVQNNSMPTIQNCVFVGNSATLGGGAVFVDSSAPSIVNCTFVQNSTNGDGGGMGLNASAPVVTNCTFSGNLAVNGGGIHAEGGSSPMVTNSILWNDSPNEIHVSDPESSAPDVTESDVMGGFLGKGNINKDPLFLNATDGDFHLKTGSPCIDRGNNEAAAIPPLDQEGNPRIVNAIVDMGALEYQLKAAFYGDPISGPKPLSVLFTDQSCSTCNIVSWGWDFGDGGKSEEQNPAHTYQAAGQYTVTLHVTDIHGNDDNKTQENYITVTEPAPLASFTVGKPTSGPKPLKVTFTNTSKNAISYLWTFKDGRTSSSISKTLLHTFQIAGSFHVTLKAVGPGGEDTFTGPTPIVVYDPLVAQFRAAPVAGFAPLQVKFTNESTGASSYVWDFGDGTSGIAENPSHKYSKAGTFTVKLTAKGNGKQNTATGIVKVYAPVVANFTANKTTVKINAPVSFTDRSTGKDIKSWLWSFGDGKTSTARNPTKKYTKTGVYTVSLTVTNAGGSNTRTRRNYITVTK